MAFTQRVELGDRISILVDMWYTDANLAADKSLGQYIAETLITEGWIKPEITEAESDGMIASILAIE